MIPITKINKMGAHEFQNMLWTVISSGVHGVYALVLIFVTTRLVGLAMAGVLAYSLALTELHFVIGEFGVRGYQSTDIKQEFKLSHYFTFRISTVVIVSLIFIVLVFLGNYDYSNILILLICYVIVVLQMFADVFMGDLQQKGYMNIAGKMKTVSYVGAFVLFTTTTLVTKTLLLPLIFSGLAVLIIYASMLFFYRNFFINVQICFELGIFKKIFISVLPLVILAFIGSYLVNAQKYYLARYASDEYVAIFAILMLPSSVFLLFCGAMFAGSGLTKGAKILATGQLDVFNARIIRQLVAVFALAIPFILGGYFFGIPILSILYGLDLSGYSMQFLLLMVGSVFHVAVAVLGSALVIMRLQRLRLICTAASGLFTGLLMWLLVRNFGIYGAAYSLLIIYVPLSIFLFIAFWLSVRRLMFNERRVYL